MFYNNLKCIHALEIHKSQPSLAGVGRCVMVSYFHDCVSECRFSSVSKMLSYQSYKNVNVFLMRNLTIYLINLVLCCMPLIEEKLN